MAVKAATAHMVTLNYSQYCQQDAKATLLDAALRPWIPKGPLRSIRYLEPTDKVLPVLGYVIWCQSFISGQGVRLACLRAYASAGAKSVGIISRAWSSEMTTARVLTTRGGFVRGVFTGRLIGYGRPSLFSCLTMSP